MPEEEDAPTDPEVEVSEVGTIPGPRPFEPLAQLAPKLEDTVEGEKTVVVPAPKKPSIWDFDFDRNGVPDLKEPWLYRLGVRLIARAIRSFAAPKTLAAKHVADAEMILGTVIDAVEAESKTPKQGAP